MVLAASQLPPATTPQLTFASVFSTGAGACSGTAASPSASIRVSWSAINFDPALHVFKVYENNILKAITTDTLWDKTITNSIENGPYSQWTSDWTYRIDIENVGNGAVRSTMSTDTWAQLYGSCRDEENPF